MNPQFILKKDGYYKARKGMFYFWLAFPFFFTALMWGIFYFTRTEFQKPLDWFALLFPLLFIIPMLTFKFLGGLSKANVQIKSYKVILDVDSIKLEQLGHWDEVNNQFLFFKPKYNINYHSIPYAEITAIQKSKNGSFIIKGMQDSYPNTLIISPNIERAKDLEIALSEIKPISQYSNPTKTGKETVFKNTPQELYNSKTIFTIIGIYLIVLLFSYFWFNPINWSLTAFLSIFFLLFFFGLTWRFRKMDHTIYSLTLDDSRIIIENKGANLMAIPLNQIVSIRKYNAKLIIVGNQVNSSIGNLTVIPNTLENFEALEQQLNTIQPIIYKKGLFDFGRDA